MVVPVGMKEFFLTQKKQMKKKMLRIIKGNIWFMLINMTILEKVCQ